MVTSFIISINSRYSNVSPHSPSTLVSSTWLCGSLAISELVPPGCTLSPICSAAVPEKYINQHIDSGCADKHVISPASIATQGSSQRTSAARSKYARSIDEISTHIQLLHPRESHLVRQVLLLSLVARSGKQRSPLNLMPPRSLQVQLPTLGRLRSLLHLVNRHRSGLEPGVCQRIWLR